MRKKVYISVLLLVGVCGFVGGEVTWKSLEHEAAEWLMDAKFGVYTY